MGKLLKFTHHMLIFKAMLNSIVLFALALFMVGCQTTGGPSKSGPAKPSQPAWKDVSDEKLYSMLGLPEKIYEVGLKEHTFNPCKLDVEPYLGGECGTEYMSVVHFQMVCRKTHGTVSEISDEHPLYDPDLDWEIGGAEGWVKLDQDGFGTIKIRTKYPIRKQKIKLRSGNDFLRMQVEDIRKVLVPGDWCS